MLFLLLYLCLLTEHLLVVLVALLGVCHLLAEELVAELGLIEAGLLEVIVCTGIVAGEVVEVGKALIVGHHVAWLLGYGRGVGRAETGSGA